MGMVCTGYINQKWYHEVYYDGFIAECVQVGNTKLICEAVADSNILNIKSQPTQTTAQPTQEIQPTATGG